MTSPENQAAGPIRLPRPEPGLRPEQLYARFVPRLVATLLAGRRFSTAGIGIAVRVDQPPDSDVGQVNLWFDGQAVSVMTDGQGAPLLRFEMNQAAWRVGVRDVLPRLLTAVEEHWTALQRGLGELARRTDLSTREVELRALPGRIVVDYSDDAGDNSRVTIDLGTGVGRQVHVLVREDDLAQLLAGQINLTRLLRTRLRVDGDVAWVLRLAQILEP